MSRYATLFVLVCLPLLSACPDEVAPGATAPKPGTERVALRVDDAVIAGHDAFAVFEPVWWSADIYGSLEEYEASLRPFSRGQRLLSALHWYISEVNNGGHEQFYANSTGIVWPDALAAFEVLGLTEGAELLRESADLLGGSPAREREARERQLEERTPDFEELDQRFYAFQERTDLNARMLDYARAHAAEFRFDGTIERPVAP